MTKKLTDITTSYSSFENDQVLTATQMNTFLSYFDDQDRMSRICLSGVGIVCGFKVSYSGGQLTLTPGTGITTDGDLIKLYKTRNNGTEYMSPDPITYSTFNVYSDEKAIYNPFFYPDGPANPQMPIWELLPSTATVPGTPITSLPNLENKVVLLYLESYNEEEDLCVGLNCDNLGIHEVQKLRVLLVNEADAEYIRSCDPIFKAGDLFETYMGLDDVVVPRVVLNQVNTNAFAALRDSYKNAITLEPIVDNMRNSFSEMLTKVGMTTEAGQIDTKLNALFGANALQNQPVLYFQYRYDALKDIVDTYMEMKELFLHSNTDCCPDIAAFPKHLMLGKLIPTANDTLTNHLRHSFYASPLLGDGQDSYALFKNLVKRVLDQLNSYIATSIPRGEIKITPSVYGTAPLGDGAIPYYYNLQDSLLKSWNYEKTLRNKQRRNLSYHTTLLDASNAIQKPLKFNLEPYNFLRIEGHQGYQYKEAMDKINMIRQTNGLSFDLKALGITISPNETINIADYECEFADLTTMLNSLRAEHECILGNAAYYLSSYSLTTENKNDRELEFYYLPKPTRPLIDLGGIKQNVILSKLNTKEGYTGRILSEAFRTYEGCSANDIIAQIQVAFSKYNFKTWNKVTYDATINKPAEALSNALLLLNYFPASLPELTRDRIAQYAINARNICGLVRRVKGLSTGEVTPAEPMAAVASESVSAALKVAAAAQAGDYNLDYNADFSKTGIADKAAEPAMIQVLMSQMAKVCCSTAQLESIMDQIEERKQRILLGLKLSKFIESHPGLEHLGGTKQGGTFVLAYLTNPVNGIPANTVIADFTLPYLCCSDCNSVNFIMPRPAATLGISKDRFCIGNDTSPLVFTPYPLNGVIKADRVVPGMTINGTQLLINPSQIPNSILGTPIYFTVNEQVTGTSVTIYRSPQVNFTVPESPTTQTQITFSPTVAYAGNDATYLWDFGDGNTSTNKVVEHRYDYPVNEDNKVTVSLTVTPANGACPTTVKKDITFLDYQVNMTPKEFCNNDTTIYPFTVVPEDADVVITGEGVVPFDDTTYGFQPSEAPAGQVEIFVNDASWMELTVKPNPTCNVVGTAGTDGLTLTSNMSDVGTYVWTFDNQDGEQIHPNISTDKNPFIAWDDFDGTPETIVVNLYVNNECGAYSQTISVPFPIDFEACSIESAGDIGKSATTLTSMIESAGFDELSDAQKELFVTAKEDVFDEVTSDMTAALEGQKNDTLMLTLSSLVDMIHGEIVATHATPASATRTTRLEMLERLYQQCAYIMFPSLIRCQSEDLIDTDAVADLMLMIANHLKTSFGDSFPTLGIDMDPGGTMKMTMNGVLEYRATGSASWNGLNLIISLI